jgi:hypothetical protein
MRRTVAQSITAREQGRSSYQLCTALQMTSPTFQYVRNSKYTHVLLPRWKYCLIFVCKCLIYSFVYYRTGGNHFWKRYLSDKTDT